ncbi:polyprenyl diphosphate synthase [Streptomyces dubilierae]|uniref:Isoprenyl transferase n=1 Tax=Streptomyces dubilierae TaxID=3075533 RepID=A0ABU2PEE8_9ACTN|nr:polyprenyl diphosphate synthase [Streptomyces sp. DSM 41921]MDT0390531.1 polyprenyl diphosphate synthase [Streptomyces sp. DSM 41921]
MSDAPADPALRAAYRLCRRRTKTQDPAEYALIQLVPAPLRPALHALWAAANALDDLGDDRTAPAAERAVRVEAWITALHRELPTGTSPDPIRRALVDTAARWRLDLSELHDAMTQVRDDTEGRRFTDWAQWRAWGRENLLPWFSQVRSVFDRAGVPVALRLDTREAYEEFLDGVRLTDILTDLSADLAEGDLLLPEEALGRHPGAAEDLVHRRWSPAVSALVGELTGLARRWVAQETLTRGMHPGPATVLHTMAALLGAQLDAVDAAGPSLLRTRPRPSLRTRARILAPARTRAALAWSLTPLSLPPARPPDAPQPVPAPVRPAAAPAFRRPPPHPSGERPPAIPAAHLPTHVAVIMDGNGRWAQQRGLPRHEGHRAGAHAVREVVHGALEMGLRHLTLYTFSTENWSRDREEVDAILGLLRDEVAENPFRDLDVHLRWHGRAGRLPPDLADLLHLRERTTRGRTGLTLTMCIDYGGRDEITRTAAALARRARAGQLDPDRITDEDFARHLPHPDMPDVDLLWRTGNEQRTSNFLPWHSAYAELHFTPGLWPDTDRRDLWQAVTAYTGRQRRLGAESPNPLPL